MEEKKQAEKKVHKMVQTFGRKKNAVALAKVEDGKGLIKVNGKPIQLIEPAPMRIKVFEPILILGEKAFSKLNIRVRVNGGGPVAQIYAIRQAISKGVVAFAQKYIDEDTKRKLKESLLQYDRSLLVADSRRCEPKKCGGPGARARQTKSYR